MSLMFARRRQEAKKVHEAAKAAAHKENHARVQEAAKKPEPKKEAKDGAQPAGTK